MIKICLIHEPFYFSMLHNIGFNFNRGHPKCHYFQKCTKHTFLVSKSVQINIKAKNTAMKLIKISLRWWKCKGINIFCYRPLLLPKSMFCTFMKTLPVLTVMYPVCECHGGGKAMGCSHISILTPQSSTF